VPAGQDFPEQSLQYVLDKLRDATATPIEDGYPGPEITSLVSAARARTRELIVALQKVGDAVPAEAKEYQEKLLSVLRSFLHDLRGAHEIFFDVGDDNPRDGAVVELKLPQAARQEEPQQVFAGDRTFQLAAVVQATGADLTSTLQLTLAGKKEVRAVELKAGQRQTFNFPVDCHTLAPGAHQAKVELLTTDAVPSNNSRYVSFAVQQPRQILVLADDPRQAEDFLRAHKALGDFTATTARPKEIEAQGLAALEKYPAVVLFNVNRPSETLWESLKLYVRKGGGLAVVPGGEGVNVAAYNSAAAREVLPAQLVKVVAADSTAAGRWDWDTIEYQHAMMAPFREWKGNLGIEFVRFPRSASRYWDVQPRKGEGSVLVAYAANGRPPALVARSFAGKGGRQGRVLLFTTRLDASDSPWNDYLKSLGSSFYLALVRYSGRYLAGDLQPVRMNFISGQTVPVVALPLAQRLSSYTLWRDGELVDTVAADAAQNDLRFPQALTPGNYAVKGEERSFGAFSVNIAPEESLLTRVPVAEVESLFGEKSVAPLDLRADLRQALSGWRSEAAPLLPYLMIALLLLLAVENLLANKFYRKQAEPGA
jgi:hypothetical protein